MTRKNFIYLIFAALTLLASNIYASDKPIKHIIIEDITSNEEAVKVFTETTQQLKAKTKLDNTEMNEIHVITYSLEKAVAYFSENTVGEQKDTAIKMAEVVEMIHLGSENNRSEETAQSLEQYFVLADDFATKF